jgi:two-component system cell cycle response regulator
LKQDPETRHIPIIAITAAPEQFRRDEAMKAGCDAYIMKPVDTRKLPDQVATVAAKSSL